MIRKRWKRPVKSLLYRIASIVTGTIVLSLAPHDWTPILAMGVIETVHYFQFYSFDILWKKVKHQWFTEAW